MKFFYASFILVQFLLALLARDKNRIAYLMYLWSSQIMENESSKTDKKQNSTSDSHYRETKSEASNYEYSLLLEG